MEVPETAQGCVDVAAIVKRLRQDVMRDREHGILTREDVDREELARRRRSAERAGIDPRLVSALLHPSNAWNTKADYQVRSARPGLTGLLIVLVKRLIKPLVRLYTDHIVNRQTQINLYFASLLEDSVSEIVRLESEIKQLRHRCRKLEEARDQEPCDSAS